MDYQLLMILTCLCSMSTIEGFWWRSAPVEEPSTLKGFPVSYIRSVTYQPFSFQSQSMESIAAYQTLSRYFPNAFGTFSLKPLVPAKPELIAADQLKGTENLVTQSSTPPSTTSTTTTKTTTVTTPIPTTKTTAYRPTSPATAETTYNIPAKLAALYEPEASNMQYMSNMAALNSQNVKFVPCLCPVAINAPERRMDELNLVDDQNLIQLEDTKT